jgi:molybdopterin-guanine dinucleotide biosynthesis protein MobB
MGFEWQAKCNAMKRLHIIGGKNHGKTTLVVELVKEFARRGIPVGTIKHTHHHHELDVPGKDSYRHRMAGASVVGILSPSMSAVYLPIDDGPQQADRYAIFAPMFLRCQFALVEGDVHTTAPKIEVWRSELGTRPLIGADKSILAIVTDDTLSITGKVLSRSDVVGVANWILSDVFHA